jgi:peptide/nickel transport system permease protein
MMKSKHMSMNVGRAIIFIYFLIFLLSFFWTPCDPYLIDNSIKFQPPSLTHLLGTDNFGRDILSRVMVGSQSAFILAVGSVGLAFLLGLIIGGFSGYVGGVTDELLMHIIDALMAFPGILFAIMLVSVFGPGIKNTIIALGVMGIPYFSRVTRSGFLQIKESDYVKSAMSKGANGFHIAVHHIIPNIKNQLVVAITLSISTAIISEAGLSYLGLGVRPPRPSWGRMLKEAQVYFTKAPWYFLATGIALSLMVLGFTLYGDGLRNKRTKETNR